MNDAARQRICILGSTGSVGVSTLDVLSRHTERYEVFALTAYSRIDELFAQCVQWRPRFAAVCDAAQAQDLRLRLHDARIATEVLVGAAALCELAAHADVQIVMAAIVGAAGLAPCLAAARAGKRLLLANKEALVVGGELFMRAVREGGATLLPIDSEHSALAQLGTPDMRVPIAFGLSFPERIASGAAQLDFETLSTLSFEPADLVRYPGLQLAWDTLRGASGSTTVLNAANEEAVAAFLAGSIRFDQIHSVNAAMLESVRIEAGDAASVDALMALDARTRRRALERVKQLA